MSLQLILRVVADVGLIVSIIFIRIFFHSTMNSLLSL